PVVVVLGVTSGCATQMTPPTDGGGEPDRAGTAPRELPPTPLDTIDTNSGLHSRATEAVVQALAQLGTPYRWGGESANHGFDCSGLTQYAYQAANISLPRTSYRQYRATRRVDRQALRPGDLVFFHLNGRRIDHVGIYVGGKRFVHAPSTGKTVSFARLDNPFWSRRYAGGGRAPEASILQLAEHLSNDR
ncbi:MAG TPA: NlpC/P60 family protein, partial [Chromatiales bacterium]|nr:NlpC/P60 family protein [Chromatiales bacterium]